jgi:bifunctional lysine-specific demethylase and histidyl-hydroxylase NO66
VLDAAADDLTFRRSLPPGWPYDDDLAGRAVKGVVADLVDWLGRLDPATVAATLRDRFVANRTPLLDGQLHEVLALGAVDDATVVRRRASTILHLARDDDVLRLTLGDREVVLPAPLEPAVRRLTDGDPHRVGDLADLLDGPSRMVLVRRLIREGALRTGAPGGDG